MELNATMWLAQAGTAGEAPPPPALPGETIPQQGAQPAPGGNSPQRGTGGFDLIWPLLLVFLVVIVLSSLTGRKERKRRDQMLRDLGKGDRVQTTGGILGTVIELDSQEMVLRVDEASNTRIRFSRAAVQQVIRSSRDKTESKPADDRAGAPTPQIETRPAAPARV